MTLPSKLIKAEGPGAGRRSTRISIAIPITISGKDANGRPFKENTRTIILNKHGAKIVTVHQLALGAEVLLENRALGRTAKTTVAWLGDRPTAREPAEVGIQLMEAENIWGIELPPDDWQEGPPPKEARKSATPATALPAAAKSAAAPAASRPIDVPGQGAPQETPTRVDKELDRAAQQKYDEIQQQLAAARAEMEGIQGKIRELKELVLAETERSQQEVRTAGGVAIQSASEELGKKVSQGLETIDTKIQEHRAELSRQMDSTLEEFQRKSESLVEDVQSRLDKALAAVQEKAPGAVRESLERGSRELVSTLSKDFQLKASSSLGPLLDELGEDGRKIIEDSRKHLSTLSQQTRHRLEMEAAKLADEQIIHLKKQFRELQAQRADEMNEAVKGAMEKRRDAILSQSQTQLEKAYKAAHEKSVAEFKQSIREELLKEFEEAAAEFDKRTQENLELFTDQISEKKDEIVAQAAETVRSKIGQMFLSPQASIAKSSGGEGSK